MEENFVYKNPLEWADHLEITKPNERAKIVAERTAWNIISNPKSYSNEEISEINLSTILPYFMTGPPLLAEQTFKNSSCSAIS